MSLEARMEEVCRKYDCEILLPYWENRNQMERRVTDLIRNGIEAAPVADVRPKL